MGQWFVNLTAYHGPWHSELFYEENEKKASWMIRMILRDYNLEDWYDFTYDEWMKNATDYFSRPPWKGGVLSNNFKQD